MLTVAGSWSQIVTSVAAVWLRLVTLILNAIVAPRLTVRRFVVVRIDSVAWGAAPAACAIGWLPAMAGQTPAHASTPAMAMILWCIRSSLLPVWGRGCAVGARPAR